MLLKSFDYVDDCYVDDDLSVIDISMKYVYFNNQIYGLFVAILHCEISRWDALFKKLTKKVHLQVNL